MIALALSLALVSVAPDDPAVAPVEAAREPMAPPADRSDESRGPWRILGSAGELRARESGSRWVGLDEAPALELRVERGFAAAPSVALFAAAGMAPGSGAVSGRLVSAAAGVVWTPLGDGLWGRIDPYVLAGVGGGWLHVEAAGGLAADGLTPSASAAVGVRFATKPGPGRAVRFVVFAEAGYGVSRPISLELRPSSGDTLPGPATRLGRVDVSGLSLRVGAGFQL